MSHVNTAAEEAALAAAALKGDEAQRPLYSLHAAQMRPHAGSQWQECPARLFLQQGPGAFIIALCGTTSRQFQTSTYDGYRFKLGEREFTDRFALLEFFSGQRELMMRMLGQTGAVLLRTTGEVEAVTPALDRVLSLEQMQQAVGGFIDVHTWDGEQEAHQLGDTCLVIEEEGKYYGRPINALATCCWYQVYPLGVYSSGKTGAADVIVGDVLLVREAAIWDR